MNTHMTCLFKHKAVPACVCTFCTLPSCLIAILCSALDAFCEHLEAREILPYVPQLVEQLLAVLQSSNRPDVQEMALSAVSSIAAAAQGAFQPYVGRQHGHLDPGHRAP